MGLYERIVSQPEGSTQKIPAHAFSAALAELADGGAGAPTRLQVVTAFNLMDEDLTELDAIQARYAGLSEPAKSRFLERMHRVFLLVEDGMYSKARAKERLGF